MSPRKKPVREMTLENMLGNSWTLSSMNFGGFRPAVFRDGEGYSVRVRVGVSLGRDGYRSEKWDYFEFSPDKICNSCPRGYSKEYRGIRVTDLEEMVEKYKDLEV